MSMNYYLTKLHIHSHQHILPLKAHKSRQAAQLIIAEQVKQKAEMQQLLLTLLLQDAAATEAH